MPIITVDHRQVKAWLVDHRYDVDRLRGSVGRAVARFENLCYSRLCHTIRSLLLKGDVASTAEALTRISYSGSGFPEC